MMQLLYRTLALLDGAGAWLAPLGLRLILAWEYFESGLEKFRGENWFGEIRDQFTFPFSVVPPEISWQLATWFELVGGIALLVGLGTRFFSVSLFVLTVVAIGAVHWPAEWHTLAELAQGYALTDKGQGNYKLPLIFLVMLLPLILGGDWNDGMNRVGEGGKGESVWLGWFLLKTLGNFARIARDRGAARQAKAWERHASKLKQAIEHAGWDGEWYRRGTYDDGTPLGSRHSDECQIDSIAQSWSVLSGEGDPARSRTAMESATRALVDEEVKIIKLFAPPFSDTPKEPGYIKSYPPGVRENGGQYTHAAIWFVIALAEMGRADAAYAAFSMLNPVNHALDEAAVERYRTEPYVVAADVYSAPDKAGRGGWTWYTGSAGWLYRAAVESILGIVRERDRLVIRPSLPGHWDGFSATLRLSGTCFRIRVRRQDGLDGPVIEVDGDRREGSTVEIGSGGEVDVAVLVPARPPAPAA